ncbi:MAG: hypothetical protein IPI41_10440 [Flavobacteriales bacterium]|nr:hypothetical protein [Flavobacteriales bacterium]
MTNGSWEYANAKCAVTGSGAVYIVGSQHMPQQQHGYLVRLDPNGSLAWYKLFGDGLYLPFPIDPLQPGFELPNGDLEFGLRTRQFFTSAGVHLGGAARSLPTTVIGSEQFIRHTGYGERCVRPQVSSSPGITSASTNCSTTPDHTDHQTAIPWT